MKLSGLSLLVLKALYQAKGQRGDVVDLLNKGKHTYSIDQIQADCEELEKYGLITVLLNTHRPEPTHLQRQAKQASTLLSMVFNSPAKRNENKLKIHSQESMRNKQI